MPHSDRIAQPDAAARKRAFVLVRGASGDLCQAARRARKVDAEAVAPVEADLGVCALAEVYRHKRLTVRREGRRAQDAQNGEAHIFIFIQMRLQFESWRARATFPNDHAGRWPMADDVARG
eukprot:319750-Prymnesium_polylepis.1